MIYNQNDHNPNPRPKRKTKRPKLIAQPIPVKNYDAEYEEYLVRQFYLHDDNAYYL